MPGASAGLSDCGSRYRAASAYDVGRLATAPGRLEGWKVAGQPSSLPYCSRGVLQDDRQVDVMLDPLQGEILRGLGAAKDGHRAGAGREETGGAGRQGVPVGAQRARVDAGCIGGQDRYLAVDRPPRPSPGRRRSPAHRAAPSRSLSASPPLLGRVHAGHRVKGHGQPAGRSGRVVKAVGDARCAGVVLDAHAGPVCVAHVQVLQQDSAAVQVQDDLERLGIAARDNAAPGRTRPRTGGCPPPGYRSSPGCRWPGSGRPRRHRWRCLAERWRGWRCRPNSWSRRQR